MAIRWDRRASRAPSGWKQCRYASGKKTTLTRRMIVLRYQNSILASRVYTVNNYDLFRKPGIPGTSSYQMIISIYWITNCSGTSASMPMSCKKLESERNVYQYAWWSHSSKSSWCGYANSFRYEKSNLLQDKCWWKLKILDVYTERLQKYSFYFDISG